MARPATAAVRLLTGEREPVRLATTANITLSGLQTIDGVLTEAGDRILVRAQTDGSENGIYTANDGLWQRASDARSARSMQKGTTVHVQQGTANAGNVYSFQTYEPVIGTDDIVLALYLSDDSVGVINAAVAAGVVTINETGAGIVEDAEDAADRAEAAAASVALPNPAVADTYLRFNAATGEYNPLTGDQVMDERFLGVIVAKIAQGAGTAIGNMTAGGGLAAGFDGNASKLGSVCAQAGTAARAWIGKTYPAPVVIDRVTIFGSNNDGFIATANPSMTWNVRGKTGAPFTDANIEEGTILGTFTFTDTANERGGRDIECDNGAAWDHVIVESPSVGQGGKRIAQVVFYSRRATGIFRESAKVRSVQEPVSVKEAVPSTGGQPFRMDGLSIETALWNQVMAGINSGDLKWLKVPAGESLLDAPLDPFLIESDETVFNGARIEGAGKHIARLRMMGNVTSYFVYGDATKQAAFVNVSGMSLINNQPLLGSAVAAPFNFRNASHCFTDDIYFHRTQGVASYGDPSIGTQAAGCHMSRLNGSLQTSQGAKSFHWRNAAGCRVFDSHFGMVGVAHANWRAAALIPEGGAVLDSNGLFNVEFNDPAGGSGVFRFIDLDATDGIITNTWLTEVIADHCSGVGSSVMHLRIGAGAGAANRITNVFVNAGRLSGDDANAVTIELGEDRPIRAQFNGGILQSDTKPALVLPSRQVDIQLNDVRLVDTGGVASRAAILVPDGAASGGLQVVGASLSGINDGGNWSHLVEFAGRAINNVVVGNKATNAKVGDIKADGMVASSIGKNTWDSNQALRNAPLVKLPTTDATTLVLAAFALEDNRTYVIEAQVAARRTDATADAAGWRLLGTFSRNAAGVAVLHGTVNNVNSGHATWTATMVVSSNSVQVRVTGAAATPIDWGVHEWRVSEVS